MPHTRTLILKTDEVHKMFHGISIETIKLIAKEIMKVPRLGNGRYLWTPSLVRRLRQMVRVGRGVISLREV